MFSDGKVLEDKEEEEAIKYRLNYDIRRFYGQFNMDNEVRGVRQYFTYKYICTYAIIYTSTHRLKDLHRPVQRVVHSPQISTRDGIVEVTLMC